MIRTAQRWETGRVEAFSDGVFAIAITLLVLDIQVEPERFDDLWHALAEEWPAYLAYVTSFLTVGGVWLAHHGLFTRLRYVDPVLMRLNVLLLMVAAFLPFRTGLLAEAFHASRDAERAAAVAYGGTAILIELLLVAAVRYAIAHPELLHGEPPAPAEQVRNRRAPLGTGLYSAALVVGILLLPRLAAVGYLLVAVRAVLFPGGEGRLTLRIRGGG
jgi:uncharacterized membrane protein